jgi:adenylate cyclase
MLFVLLLLGFHLFVQKGLWLNLTYPALNIILIITSGTAYCRTVEERHSKQIRDMFSDYVTARVVDELVKNPAMAKLGGERRELTILFSDIRDFTTFSEKHSPEETVALLNEYLTAMTEVVFRWEGTLDKFIGDAILAFWGAPLRQDNHAELAVRCAMNMVVRLEELQGKWREEGKPILQCGIGINTGEVLVGNIGASGKKKDYTVIGDHVNLGSRVESLTKKYNSTILITEYTLDKIRDLIARQKFGHSSFTGLENVIVKGKEKPVAIFRISVSKEGEPCIIREVESQGAVKLNVK